MFQNYVFYAHCGGRFDLNLLIRDVICRDPRVTVNKAVELNSSWVVFKIIIRIGSELDAKSYKLTFKDSFKIFGSSLADVTKNFCKKTFKTHLDHNIINMLSRYMLRDNNMKEIQGDIFADNEFNNSEHRELYESFMRDAR